LRIIVVLVIIVVVRYRCSNIVVFLRVHVLLGSRVANIFNICIAICIGHFLVGCVSNG
jgi:hypothetical protein